MKKLTQILGILMLSFLTVTVAQAQDASLDDILKNYFENIGGEDEWKKIKSMTMKGNTSAQGMTMPVTIQSMYPTYFKMEMDFQGKKFITAYNGKTAWTLNPFMGGSEPTRMDEEETKSKSKQKFQDEFIDYKEKGSKIELVGTEEVDGTETYKVKMVKKDGDVVFYFFDTENYVPIMTRSLMESGPMKGQSIETFMSDYQEVDGLMVAFTTEQKMGGNPVFSMTAEDVIFNDVDIEANNFAFPSEEEKDENEKN